MNAWRLAGIERWFLRAGLFVLPLAYSWDTFDQYVLPKLLVARTLVIGLVILLLLRALAQGQLMLKRTSLDIPLLVFLGSALVSTVLAYNLNVAIFGTYLRYDGLLTTLTYLALFWLSIQTLRGPDDARAMIRVLLVSGYVVAVLAITQSVRDATSLGSFSPSYGTLGHPNVAGAFLAMLPPLAFFELVDSKSWSSRLLALNALVVILAALFFSLSRSAWLASAAAAVILVWGWRVRAQRLGLVAGLVVIGGLLIGASLYQGGQGAERHIGQRFLSVFAPADWGARPHVWRDSLPLVASRPLFGYGPDNFGLVYPQFQTGKWEVASSGFEVQFDKAHAETLQVAATQGLVGLAAYLVILGAFVRSFWRGRRNEQAVALFAAWAGYQVTVQLNFTALGAAFPFWIMAAAAIEVWEQPAARVVLAAPVARALRLGVGAMSVGALAAVAAVVVAFPIAADYNVRQAVDDDLEGRAAAAGSPAAAARMLAPYESVYAVEVGNLAFERSDWAAARSAYRSAADLGTYNPRVFRNLALADRNLGLTDEALAAARQALALDRFDPANLALVDQLKAQNP